MALGIVTAHVEGRPDHLPIPLDTMHEFLKEPLPRTHPVLCAWIESFALGRVRFALVKVDGQQALQAESPQIHSKSL